MLWLVYVVTDTESLPWVALGVLVVVALLGWTMFFRWLGVRRGSATTVGAGAGSAAPQGGEEPSERGLPVPVVAVHGLVAVVTVVLVLLAALGIGGD